MRFSPVILRPFATLDCDSESSSVDEDDSQAQKQNVETNVEDKSSPATSAAEPVETQEQAIAEIKKLGGSVAIDVISPNKPVVEASFFNTNVTDAGLEHLKGLTCLKGLYLDNADVTDAGLKHLKRLTKLQRLWLSDTKVADTGLEHLKGLTNLEWLFINGTKVTDSGLEHLIGLTNLKLLKLVMTEVTDEGVNKLQTAIPKCRISH